VEVTCRQGDCLHGSGPASEQAPDKKEIALAEHAVRTRVAQSVSDLGLAP
jgi:hypothetical protein